MNKKIINGTEHKCKDCGETVNIEYFPLGLLEREYLKVATPIGFGSAKYYEWTCKECNEELYKNYIDGQVNGGPFMSNLVLAMKNFGEEYVCSLYEKSEMCSL